MASNHNTYELTYVINAVISDNQVQDLIKRVSSYVTENGGEVIEVDQWGSRRLAYPIMKKRNGFYVNMYFRAPGSIILRLERSLEIDDNVLRYLTMKMDAKMIRHYEYQKTVRSTHAPIEEKPKSDSGPAKSARSEGSKNGAAKPSDSPATKDAKKDATKDATKDAKKDAAKDAKKDATKDAAKDATKDAKDAGPAETEKEEAAKVTVPAAEAPAEAATDAEAPAEAEAPAKAATEAEADSDDSDTTNPKAEGAEA